MSRVKTDRVKTDCHTISNMGVFACPPIGFNPRNFPEVQLKGEHANLARSQTRQLAHSPEVVRRKFTGFI